MESIWHTTARRDPGEPLRGDHRADAVVIGGGLTGILTAHFLSREGLRVLVLEAGRIGYGQTGNTTAKVTSQHGMIYHRLERTLGHQAARTYAAAHQEAIDQYEELIGAEKIACGWERVPAFLYTTTDLLPLLEESRSARQAGLPARFTEEPALPFPVMGALRFEDQAQFHPLQFLYALAENLTVFENSRVTAVEGNEVRTQAGSVRAKAIIFACHYPFLNLPGFYFARMHQERSYVLALENAPPLQGHCYSIDPGGISLRQAGDLLLLGGGSHRTGENRQGGRYEALRRTAQLLFPGSREVTRWSAQDCITPDGVPYIGRFSAAKPDWYVATGFAKWGMTSAMAAAQILREQIMGREHPCAGLFSPQRHTLAASAKNLLKDGAHAVRDLSRQALEPPRGAADALPPGHGGIVEAGGKKLGVYKSPEGELFAVDPRCPHMGCQLEWNPDELSWDCPCHGSRFDFHGHLLSGPAQEDLGQ